MDELILTTPHHEIFLSVMEDDVRLSSTNPDYTIRYTKAHTSGSIVLDHVDYGEWELLGFTDTNDGPDKRCLHMYHLEVPSELEGRGFGTLAFGLHYAFCDIFDADSFSLKFGGGEESVCFLSRIGFHHSVTTTVQNSDEPHPSAVVGEIQKHGEDPKAWTLFPIDLSHYPTHEFTLA